MSGGRDHERFVDEASLRISDADRDRIASVLAQHAAEGRLTIEELDERLGGVYAALTRREVRGVMAGLPALAPPDAHRHRHLGHERGEAAVALTDWLRAEQMDRGRSTTRGVTTAVSPPEADAAGRPVPTDEVMQAAYDEWRAAVTQAKAGRRASQRAKAAGDQVAAFRELKVSVRLTAAEKPARKIQRASEAATGLEQPAAPAVMTQIAARAAPPRIRLVPDIVVCQWSSSVTLPEGRPAQRRAEPSLVGENSMSGSVPRGARLVVVTTVRPTASESRRALSAAS